MKTLVGIELKSTVTFSRPLSKDSLLVSILQYLLDPHAERGRTVSSRAVCTHTEQEIVSVLQHLRSNTDQTEDKKEVLCFQHESHNRSERFRRTAQGSQVLIQGLIYHSRFCHTLLKENKLYVHNKEYMWI